MIIRNFYEEKLAQASYLVGCAETKEAIIIDPLRDIDQYLQMAAKLGLKITAVTETHIHADYLSGTRELSAATGAKMFLSDEGDDQWKYGFGSDPKAVLMKHGHVITIGNLTLKALHTPGHTPEHMAFLLTDHPTSDFPHSLFTGDFLFIGDVGRPDLLERAANMAGTMEKGARTLFNSLKILDEVPDSVLIWPAHGAGSACGKSLGGSPVSTLAYERRTNWALLVGNEDKFVDEILSGQPEPPIYFKEMKRLNKMGPNVLGRMPVVPRLSIANGKLIDARPLGQLRSSYVIGSVAIPAGKIFTQWSGWLLDYAEPITLITNSQAEADAAARDLATIGLDVVSGWMTPSEAESAPPIELEVIRCSEVLESDFVLDVRGLNEYKSAHRADANHLPLGYLTQGLDTLPHEGRIVVVCGSGVRSLIAASILRTSGFENVVEIEGGMAEVVIRCPKELVRG